MYQWTRTEGPEINPHTYLVNWPLIHVPKIHKSLVAKSCPTLATPWTVAFQSPLSMGFSRQEYWYALPFPSPKNTQYRKNNPFNKWCWENWISTCKIVILNLYLTPYIKINSKWIQDLSVKPETIKLLKQNIGRKLHDIGLYSDFLDDTKSTDKWNHIKLQSRTKEIQQSEKATSVMGENICKSYIW